MKQFRTIFRFEYTQQLKNKAFQIVTVLGVLLVLCATTFPTVQKMIADKKSPTTSQGDTGEKEKLLLADPTGLYGNEAVLEQAFGKEYTFTVDKAVTVDDAKNKVESGEFQAALFVESPQKVTVYQKSAVSGNFASQFETYFTGLYQMSLLQKLGVTPEDTASILGAKVEFAQVETGKSFAQSAILAYVLIMLLYMSIIMYGQQVASSVAGEKSSRAMEVLITYAKPKNLMFGKVLATGFAGLTQLGAMIVAGILGYFLNRSSYQGADFIEVLVRQSVEPLIYMLVFYLLGYFIYAFLFGAVGSLASRVEDINTTSMPVIFLLIASFIIGFTAMANPESMFIKITSFVPFLSPIVMFARICMTKVALIQILISIAINLAAVIGVGMLSGKIYQLGVLMYGTPPKLKTIIKMLGGKPA